MEYCNIDSARIAYRFFGSGEKTIVVDACLGSCCAEWWHIAKALGSEYRVLVYDRAGYGESSVSTLARAPENIVLELERLLTSVGVNKDFLLVGHSQGGLYAVAYAAAHPDKVRGLLLLDPATPYDHVFKEKLTKAEYKGSGVDKTASYRLGLLLTSFGLGFAIRPLLKKAPPFYYHSFDADASKYLLKSLTKKSTYQTALSEYAFTHNGRDTAEIERAVEQASLGNLPVKLITHASGFYVEELKYYGNMDEQTAEKIEETWQTIMKRYLSLSSNAEHIIAPKSGHYIHLTDFEVVKKAIDSFLVPDGVT